LKQDIDLISRWEESIRKALTDGEGGPNKQLGLPFKSYDSMTLDEIVEAVKKEQEKNINNVNLTIEHTLRL
jgi:hypothetical protein